MFLFIPVGMLVALILYQCLTNMSTRLRLPLPGIVTKDVAFTEPENELVLVLSAWYAIYFRSWLPLESYSCQCCHAHIVILVRVVRNIVSVHNPFQRFIFFPTRSSGPETHWVVPALAGILFGY